MRAFFLALLLPFAALADAPTLALPPLATAGDVDKAVSEGWNKKLRALVAQKAKLLDEGSTKKALSAAGATPGCATDACMKGIATKAPARFSLMAKVTNADEIYKVDLQLWDQAHQKRITGGGTCELCAVDEVNGTIEAAFAEVAPALVVPPPKKEAPKVVEAPKASKFEVEVRSTPPGASLSIDGKVVGDTPAFTLVEPGTHEVVLTKEGYVEAKRTIEVKDATVKLELELEAAEEVPPPVVAPPIAEPEQPATGGGGGDYFGVGLGMTIGGVILAGAGTWLVLLDGEVTCDDGRGRRECPSVYNTKGFGIAGLGVGAALLGSGITLLAVNPGEGPAQEATVAPTPEGGAMLNWKGRW